MKNILKKLLILQTELKCRKDKKAQNYKYRSAEDILENLKPLMVETNTTLLMSDDIEGEYFKTTITLYDIESGESIENHSYTKIGSNKGINKEGKEYEKMSEGQMSGSTISYCRKYALCGMFMIDDGEDLDKVEDKGKSKINEVKEGLEETNQKMFQMSLNTFKDNIDKVDRKDKEALKSLIEEGRRLIKWRGGIPEEDKKFITDVCLGIKNEIE